jgi:hypothetical protein
VPAVEREPLAPEAARLVLEEHDGPRQGLPGLDQGEDLEGLVVGAEAAGEQADRVALLHEDELAREEVLEADLLRVAVEDGAGHLLERQADQRPEGRLAARALDAGAHHARGAAGDRHPAALRHRCGEVAGEPAPRVIPRRPRGAEDRDLAAVAVRSEDAKGMAQLLQRRVHEHLIAARDGLSRELQRRDDHFLEVGHGDGAPVEPEEVADAGVGLRARAVGGSGEGLAIHLLLEDWPGPWRSGDARANPR